MTLSLPICENDFRIRPPGSPERGARSKCSCGGTAASARISPPGSPERGERSKHSRSANAAATDDNDSMYGGDDSADDRKGNKWNRVWSRYEDN